MCFLAVESEHYCQFPDRFWINGAISYVVEDYVHQLWRRACGPALNPRCSANRHTTRFTIPDPRSVLERYKGDCNGLRGG